MFRSVVSAIAAHPVKPKLLIDCDPGHDDAVAILYAARHFDLLGITTIFGNQTVELTTRNALRVLALAGLQIPVARGFDRPLVGEAPLAPDTHGASAPQWLTRAVIEEFYNLGYQHLRYPTHFFSINYAFPQGSGSECRW